MLAAYLILLVVTAVWGLTFPLVQSALQSASPLVFVTLRFLLASLLFAAIFGRRAIRFDRELLKKGVGLGIFLWGGYAFQTIGLAHTTAARSGFLTGTFVPMTPLFAWLFFRARVNFRSWLAVAVTFAGIAVMSQPSAGGLNLGDVLTLLCAACFAMQVVLVGRWASHENEIELSWIQITLTGLLAALFIPTETAHLSFSTTLIWALAVTAVLATVLGVWAQMRFQPRISVTAAAIIYACEPVWAGIASWLILDVVPPPATLIGACGIVAGMLLSITAPAETQPHIP